MKLLENHGALIDVASEEGKGSIFTIRFPVPYRRDATACCKLRSVFERMRLAMTYGEGAAMKFKILVIDDEPILRNSLEVALKVSGYEVITAPSGEEGLELFRKESPDLILLDHWLPGMNGDEVLRLIREKDPEILVIIMTAQGSIELAVNSMKMGAFDFLVKPFDLERMEMLVQRALERIRLKKEVEWLRAQYQEKFHVGGSSP